MLLGETPLCQSRISLCRSASELRSHFCNALILKEQCVQHYTWYWNLFLFQLRAALFDIHDIFFSMTLEERLSLLQQDRELRTERKLREMVTGRTDLRLAFMFIGWLSFISVSFDPWPVLKCLFPSYFGKVQSHFHMNVQLCRSVFLSNTHTISFGMQEKAKSPKDKVILSAATQKSLDRKKRWVSMIKNTSIWIFFFSTILLCCMYFFVL